MTPYQRRVIALTFGIRKLKPDLSLFPRELIQIIISMSDIDIALRLAASGLSEDIDNLVKMVRENPELLLWRGDVVTRGGTKIIDTTLYEFFLGSGHTEALEEMKKENLFALLPDGEAERMRQYERYRLHIEQLREEVEAYKQAYEAAGNSAYHSTYSPAYDLRPLIGLIINTTNPADVTAELAQTPQSGGPETPLRQAMEGFRHAINDSQRSRTEGMHYAHYTTIMQAFDLLIEKWPELSVNDTNYDKCKLVFSQLFGYLELIGLPARERFAFARAFDDKELSAECMYEKGRAYPDFDFSNLVRTGLGFLFGIVGGLALGRGQAASFAGPLYKSHVKQKLDVLGTYAHAAADRDHSVEMRTSLRG